MARSEATAARRAGASTSADSTGSAGLKEGPVDAYGGMSYKYSDGHRDHGMSILKSAFGRVGVDLSEHEHLGFTYQRTDSTGDG